MIASTEINVRSRATGRELTLGPVTEKEFLAVPFESESVEYIETRVARGFMNMRALWQSHMIGSVDTVNWAMHVGPDKQYIGFATLTPSGEVEGRTLLGRFIADKECRAQGYGTMMAVALAKVTFDLGVVTMEASTANPYAARSLGRAGFVDFGPDERPVPCGVDGTLRPISNHVLYNVPLIKKSGALEGQQGQIAELMAWAESGWRRFEAAYSALEITRSLR